MTRSRTDLVAENAMLRQQLIILKRQVKRPKLTNGDRIRLVLLARITRYWRSALHIVQPDTLLCWHRDLFRLYWRYKSRKRRRKPRIAQETIDIIRIMANENRLWGAERIRGELLKLGIKVSKRTIQRYMPKRHRKSGQTWATFLKNHAGDIWACDFTVVHDLLFRPLYIFIIIGLKRRRIVQVAVTKNPTDAWVAQQLREATAWGKGPRYLIRDRDKKYGNLFSTVSQKHQDQRIENTYPGATGKCRLRTVHRQLEARVSGSHAYPAAGAIAPNGEGICGLLQSFAASSRNTATSSFPIRC